MGGCVYGYHKPIMLAGGLGNIRAEHVEKGAMHAGYALVVLGGPAMLIGLGGGAASSAASGNSELDFASVQRDNAEMERRAQEVLLKKDVLDRQLINIASDGARVQARLALERKIAAERGIPREQVVTLA